MLSSCYFYHTVSMLQFLFKNGKFLKSLKNGQYLNFCAYIDQKLSFAGFLWTILSQNWDIWYILESKIQEYFWILAQKFKLDYLQNFFGIKFFWQKYDFWHSVAQLDGGLARTRLEVMLYTQYIINVHQWFHGKMYKTFLSLSRVFLRTVLCFNFENVHEGI